MGRELSLYDIDRALGRIIDGLPEKKKELVRNAGEKMYEGVIRNIDSSVNEISGNLKRAVEKKLGSRGGYAAVRPNRAIAPHTHLVENGHEVVARGKGKKKRTKQSKKNVVRVRKGFGEGASAWVTGKFMYRNALTSLEVELIQDSKNMVKGLVKDAFG